MMKIFPNIHKAKAGRLSGRAATLQAGPASNRHAPSKEPGRRHFRIRDDEGAKRLVAALLEGALMDAYQCFDYGMLDEDLNPTSKANLSAQRGMTTYRARAAGHQGEVAYSVAAFFRSPTCKVFLDFLGLDFDGLTAAKLYILRRICKA